jgi:hypothetical protein
MYYNPMIPERTSCRIQLDLLFFISCKLIKYLFTLMLYAIYVNTFKMT